MSQSATVMIEKSGWNGHRPIKQARTHAETCHFPQLYPHAYMPVSVSDVPPKTPRCRKCGGGSR